MIRLQSATFLVVVTIISSLNQVRGDCTPQWSGQFTPGNPDDTVRAIGEYDDDGAGPHASQLVAVGPFRSIGDSGGTLVARYDGTQWTRFGNGPDAHSLVDFNALTTWDPDGAGPNPPALLCAGLTASYIGGRVSFALQEWDGATWTRRGQMGATGPFVFNAVTVFDPDGAGPTAPYRVVGGDFNLQGFAQGIVGFRPGPVALGSFNARTTYAVLVYDEDGAGPNLPRLFAGGSFTLASGGPGDFIARWNGTTWTSVGTGFNGTVRTLASYDPDGSGPLPALLVAGGDFTMAGATPVNHVAVWNGVAWAALGDGTDGSVYSIAAVDHDGAGPQAPILYAGGSFDNAGGASAHRVAAWNGSVWTALSGGIGSPAGAIVYALYGWDPDGAGPLSTRLYAGGNFDQVDGQEIYRIAAWDGAAWSRLTPPGKLGANYTVRAITTYTPPGGQKRLFIGGDITQVGNVVVSGIASFDGIAWSDPGGTNSAVRALQVYDDDGPGPHPAQLYAGGDFTDVAGIPARLCLKTESRVGSVESVRV